MYLSICGKGVEQNLQSKFMKCSTPDVVECRYPCLGITASC